MNTTLEPLPRGALKLLAEAIADAEAWRGSLVGYGNDDALAEFDSRIAAMRRALRCVRQQNAAVKEAIRLSHRSILENDETPN